MPDPGCAVGFTGGQPASNMGGVGVFLIALVDKCERSVLQAPPVTVWSVFCAIYKHNQVSTER